MPILGGGNFNMGNGMGSMSPFHGRRLDRDFRRMGFGPQWEGQQQFMSGLAGSDIFSLLPQRAQSWVTNWNTAHPMAAPGGATGTPDATGTSPTTPGMPTPTTPMGPHPMGGGMGGMGGMGLRGGRGK